MILHDEAEAADAVAALVAAGSDADDLKTYRSEETLASHERYVERRSVADRIVGAVTDDDEGRRLYLEYASAGRAALWVRVPDESRATTALRALADVPYLLARHYGRTQATDYHTRTD